MTDLENFIVAISDSTIQILDPSIPVEDYTPVDLSVSNTEIKGLDISQPDICENYIQNVLKRQSARVAYGGYLEKRNLYRTYESFQNRVRDPRNVHLGIDFWAKAGTLVITPLPGIVHSFKYNAGKGDYGPTIILEHNSFHRRFYTLYGHLSLSSIRGLHVGREFNAGDVLGKLGKTEINVNYAPHLHFQIINKIGAYNGDYPGVSNSRELDSYINNCPNPNLLLKL